MRLYNINEQYTINVDAIAYIQEFTSGIIIQLFSGSKFYITKKQLEEIKAL